LSGPAPISVVIASHGRPEPLRRCLTALRYQSHPRFEVVVVADRAGLDALADHPQAHAIKQLQFEEPHLARARNLGIDAAAGKVLAFIDDDAVPEPTWLDHLSRAVDREGTAAAVGAVRGRNGFSFQSLKPVIDRKWVTHDVSDLAGRGASLPEGSVPKLVGTNMAVRSDVLRALGGFDEAFRFYLEDSDLSVRLADAGHKAAFAPDAQVHHTFAASARRTADRRPLTLFEIGRSLAVFLRKHGSGEDVGGTLRSQRVEQRRRLLSHMVTGACEPADVGHLLRDFDEGADEGSRADFNLFPRLSARSSFEPFSSCRDVGAAHLLAGHPWQARSLTSRASCLAQDGHIVTVMLFSPTTLYHQRTFAPDGYWVQTGGTFGLSERSGKRLQLNGLTERVRREWKAIESVRNPSKTIIETHIAGRTRP
jgi:GT2 family glycosyltransferase